MASLLTLDVMNIHEPSQPMRDVDVVDSYFRDEQYLIRVARLDKPLVE